MPASHEALEYVLRHLVGEFGLDQNEKKYLRALLDGQTPVPKVEHLPVLVAVGDKRLWRLECTCGWKHEPIGIFGISGAWMNHVPVPISPPGGQELR